MDRIAQVDVEAAVVPSLGGDAGMYRFTPLIGGQGAPVFRTFHAPGLGGKHISGEQMGLLGIHAEFAKSAQRAVECEAGSGIACQAGGAQPYAQTRDPKLPEAEDSVRHDAGYCR